LVISASPDIRASFLLEGRTNGRLVVPWLRG
jgi:hypothetical protein